MDEYGDPWHTVPENDRWRKIEDDATLPPGAYCIEYDIDADCGDESDRIQNMCQHIALRAYKLGAKGWSE
jgi:hypothetical protein